MFHESFPQVTKLLAFASLGAAILLIVRGNLVSQVRTLTFQSLVLSLLAFGVAWFAGSIEILCVAVALLIVKGIVIPRVLYRAVAQIGLDRVAAPYLRPQVSVLVCGVLTVAAFYVMAPVAASNPLPTAGAIPLAFANVLIGFFITVNRRRALTQILGFLTLENGIFLLALLCTYGVPLIVELGVFLDVLVAVLILEVFTYRIKENFDTLDVGRMETLKG